MYHSTAVPISTLNAARLAGALLARVQAASRAHRISIFVLEAAAELCERGIKPNHITLAHHISVRKGCLVSRHEVEKSIRERPLLAEKLDLAGIHRRCFPKTWDERRRRRNCTIIGRVHPCAS